MKPVKIVSILKIGLRILTILNPIILTIADTFFCF